MATYKVIQDIEAEDKLLGPLSLRQFIYALIVAVSGFIGFRLFLVNPLFVIPLLPHTIFFALLAAPLGRDQSSEVWLLAKIRFMLKPRVRIWNQTGVQELVTITAPKKIEKVLTKSMDQAEVHSRLEALANTIDSRGWAIKNVNVNMFTQPAFAGVGSDRLVDPSGQAQTTAASAADDMLDPEHNPTAQNLDNLLNASSKAHRDQVVQQMKNPAPTAAAPPPPGPPQGIPTAPATPPADYWFLNAPVPPAPPAGQSTFAGNNIVTPTAAAANPSNSALIQTDSGPMTEEELLERIHADKDKHPKNYGHMRVIKPMAEQKAEAEAAARAAVEAAKNQPPVTPKPDPAILELANNDDLNVATIARQANKAKGNEPGDDEVVISLH